VVPGLGIILYEAIRPRALEGGEGSRRLPQEELEMLRDGWLGLGERRKKKR